MARTKSFSFRDRRLGPDGQPEPARQAHMFGATYSAGAAGAAHAAAVSSEAPRPTDETGNPAD